MPRREKWDTFKDIIGVMQTLAVILGLPAAIFGIYYNAQQVALQSKALSDNNRISSANFVLQISKQLDEPKYDKILNMIDDHTSDYPIRKKYSDGQIEDYIGHFETVGYLLTSA